MQEYRISTNNYSAEYGQTSGFIANAVTKAGGTEYHGIAYEYFKNNVLNAADFQDNLNGFGRLKDRENQFGYQTGGPILRNRLFFSSALEQLISHSAQNPQTLLLPTANLIPALELPPTRLSYQLLTKYPAPSANSTDLDAPVTLSQPVVVDRLIALERADYMFRGGKDHLMGRFVLAGEPRSRISSWSPYAGFHLGPASEHHRYCRQLDAHLVAARFE